ncbi:MAG TPA: YihY/virulence factor BrkB family protein [Silvibacterium sp.]|nr:YihY/virulence factor BrkB family protein [Silvibacterium sp.]
MASPEDTHIAGRPDTTGEPTSRSRKRSWKSFFGELFHSISDDDIFGRSAQLAYYFFFALFPGLIFLSALLGLLSGSGFHNSLMTYLPHMVPPQALHLIQQTFSEATHGGGTLTFGVLIALWSATVGMSAACDTLNAVHDVQESRPYWKVELIALALTLVTALLVLVTIGAMFSGNYMIHISRDGSLHLPVLVAIRAAQWVVAFVLIAIIFAVVYFFAPDVKERKWHWITPGATVGIVLWVVATIGLRVYLHFFNSFSATYGSLGAVIILLTWFYITGFALLTGAEINATIENKAAEEGDPEATPKGEKAPQAA